MARRTVVTCDLCKQEIVPGTRTIYLSATRWEPAGPGVGGGCVAAAKFDVAEFCGEGCALAAVRGLLNGEPA